jgi:LysM repeat protein
MPIARRGSYAALLTALVACLAAASIFAAPAFADYAHVIAPGETLTSVAQQDGLTVAALAAANGLSTTAELIAGETIEIPPQTAATVPATTTTATTSGTSGTTATTTGTTTAGTTFVDERDPTDEPDPTSGSAPVVSTAGSYVVQLGDTLTAIAARGGTTVAALAGLNGLNPNGVLLAGSALRLPAPGTTASVETTATTASTATATASDAPGPTVPGTAGPPYPTHEYVTGSEIAQIAAAHAVPSGLAQAIGWQESGFNNDEVSSAGAVGVMQITPSTWSWINDHLAGATQLAPASAASNVTGGVLLLHDLMSLTGSESEAAAGYYQGLASVQRQGMYPSTQQYVNNVMALAGKFGG